jgi:hypothetical protein
MIVGEINEGRGSGELEEANQEIKRLREQIDDINKQNEENLLRQM